MKRFCLVLLAGSCFLNIAAQEPLSKTRILCGLSAPELLHLGVATQITRSNMVGISAGVGPTWGGLWPSVNAEHRLYLGPSNRTTGRRQWFLRQSVSYFPGGEDVVFALTAGADLRSKRPGSGWTVDAGVWQLIPDEKGEQARYAPALRFQYYGLFRRHSP